MDIKEDDENSDLNYKTLDDRSLVLAEAGDEDGPCVAIFQTVKAYKRTILVKTRYQMGDVSNAETITFKVKESVASSRNVIDVQWQAMCEEIERIKERAETYLNIKTRDRVELDLLIPVLAMVLEDYHDAQSYYHHQYEEDIDDDMIEYPLTGFSSQLMSYRRAMYRYGYTPEDAKARLDAVERSVVRCEEMLEDILDDFDNIMEIAEDEFEDILPEEEFTSFHQQVEQALYIANHAWWNAALDMYEDKDIDSKRLHSEAQEMEAAVTSVKESLELFDEVIKEGPFHYALRNISKAAYMTSDKKEGIIPKLEKLQAMFSRGDLLRSAIKDGLAKR